MLSLRGSVRFWIQLMSKCYLLTKIVFMIVSFQSSLQFRGENVHTFQEHKVNTVYERTTHACMLCTQEAFVSKTLHISITTQPFWSSSNAPSQHCVAWAIKYIPRRQTWFLFLCFWQFLVLFWMCCLSPGPHLYWVSLLSHDQLCRSNGCTRSIC